MGSMALRRDGKVATTHPRAALREAIREEQDFLDGRYPADWDYYKEVVAKNPPNGEVTIPHRITGDPVRIDLLTATPDEIINTRGFPDHPGDQSLEPYRLFLKARLPYWDQRLLPDSIPLLEEEDHH